MLCTEYVYGGGPCTCLYKWQEILISVCTCLLHSTMCALSYESTNGIHCCSYVNCVESLCKCMVTTDIQSGCWSLEVTMEVSRPDTYEWCPLQIKFGAIHILRPLLALCVDAYLFTPYQPLVYRPQESSALYVTWASTYCMPQLMPQNPQNWG